MVTQFDSIDEIEKHGCKIHVCQTNSKDKKVDPFFWIMCFCDDKPIAIKFICQRIELNRALKEITEFAEDHKFKNTKPFWIR